MNLRKANRGHSKIKCALQGPSGSGKTYSALLMARGLCDGWNEVVVIDTENNSADLYSHLGDYNVFDLRPPFSPESYIKAIQECKNADMKVIVIDSISHEWEGAGGILTTHSAMAGNSFTNWSKLTPRHNAFVNTILQTDCHIIGTLRTKQDYVLIEKNGKQVPEKVGLKSITRDGLDYEFTVVFDIDIKHQAVSSKDRTGLFAKAPQFEINTNTGEIIRAWCGKALTSDELQLKIDETHDLEELRLLYSQNPQHQNELKNYFSKRRIEIQENGNTIPQN
jgi:hypothetical protein